MANQEIPMMVRDNRKPGWLFYLGWVIASALGIPIAWAITWAIMPLVTNAVGETVQVGGQSHITEDFLGLYVLLPVLGLLAGLLQYPLLRRYLARMASWIAATVLGWLLLSVVLGVLTLFAVAVPPALVIVLIGGSIGLPQWLLLRQRVRRAAVWMLASVLGWGMALLLAPGAISNQQQVLAVMLVPPLAGSIAWWLLLVKLPQRESHWGNTPRSKSMPLGAH